MHPHRELILTARLFNGCVHLDFQIGAADGITLLCRRESEPEFSAIAEDDPSPVVDDRPRLDPDQPETRYYRAVLRYSSSENRQFSNEVRVTLT